MQWWWVQLFNQKCNNPCLWIISLLQWICGNWIQHCATCPLATILKLLMIKCRRLDLTSLHREYWTRTFKRCIKQEVELFSLKSPLIILLLVKCWMLSLSQTNSKIYLLKNIKQLHSRLEVHLLENILMPKIKQLLMVSWLGRAIFMILRLSLIVNQITSMLRIEECSISSRTF